MTEKEIKLYLQDFTPKANEIQFILSRVRGINNTLTNSIKKVFLLYKIRTVGSFATLTNNKFNREVDVDVIFNDDTHSLDQLFSEVVRTIEENGFKYTKLNAENYQIRIMFYVEEIKEEYNMDLKIINNYVAIMKDNFGKNAIKKYHSSKALWHVRMVNISTIYHGKSKNAIRVLKGKLHDSNIKGSTIVSIVVAKAAENIMNQKNCKSYHAILLEILKILDNVKKGILVVPLEYYDINYSNYYRLHDNDTYKLIDPVDPRINHLKDYRRFKIIQIMEIICKDICKV